MFVWPTVGYRESIYLKLLGSLGGGLLLFGGADVAVAAVRQSSALPPMLRRAVDPQGAFLSLPSTLSLQTEIARQPSAAIVESIDQGITAYDMGSFQAAIAIWQQVLTKLTPDAEPVMSALVLNHLSLAYQQLGQLQAAETTINQSLDLLGQTPSSTLQVEVLAKAFNTQGQLLWGQGKVQAALQTWQTAEQRYHQVQDSTGQLITQINQVKAQKSLGLQTQAIQRLQTLDQQLQQWPDSRLKVTSLLVLGEALLQVGQLERSLSTFKVGVKQAKQPSLRAAALLGQGNVEQALGDQARSIGKEDQAKAYASQALRSYQRVQQQAALSLTQLDAQLNLLRLLPRLGRLREAQALWPKIQVKLATLPPSRAAIDARLYAVQSLICFNPNVTSPDCRPSFVADIGTAPAPAIDNLEPVVRSAISQAQVLADPIAESYGLGLLGHLYELMGQPQKAMPPTQQALLLLEGISASDIAYRWYWQLGRLLVQQGRLQEAKSAYQLATRVLETVRRDLVRTQPSTQFTFRDVVEPVYRQYVSLLLRHDSKGLPTPSDLELAIQEIDALQLSELENFLGCDLSDFAIAGSEEIDQTAAILYPILLSDRVAIIYRLPGQPLAYAETRVSRTQVEATVETLRKALTRASQTPEVLVAAQQLYVWLITPLETELEQQPRLKTLVFAADGILRNIPMSVLYDGQQYLIEKGYGIAVAPRLRLFRASTARRPLKIAAGGVSLPQVIEGVRFPAIAQVQQELALIPDQMTARQPLIDRDFTKANLDDQLQRGIITGIHWKTHGVFSSDPQETYLVGYQERIRTTDLDQLIQSFLQGQANPLELLILSACSTAQGDRRAVLGMAGVAVRAGAQSTLSTLWQANDAATTKLTHRFYKALLQPQVTKAEALRLAQLGLIEEEGYTAPHYWATYLMLGNWR